MGTAMVTTALIHRPAGAPLSVVVAPTAMPGDLTGLLTRVSAVFAVTGGLIAAAVSQRLPNLSYASLGSLFGAGLILSGMNLPMKHLGFLNVLGGAWDPSLACVLGAGVAVSMLSYSMQKSRRKPTFAALWSFPTSTEIEKSLVIGGALFGVAWALGTSCPGPVLANITGGIKPVVWLAAMMAGNIAAGFVNI